MAAVWIRIARLWRIFATGFCFSVFGIGGILLTLLVFPLLRLFVRSPDTRRRYAQRLISLCFYGFVLLMRGVGVMSWKVQARERLNRRGHLIIANHPSLIDVVMLIALMPEVDCIVNAERFRNPFTGGPIRAAGYINNSDGPELIEQCRAALQQGRCILVFPEGTRSKPGKPLDFRRGPANIALHAQADIVPATILFSESTLTKGDSWYQVPKRRFRVNISVDTPILVQPYLDNCESVPLAARKLTQDLRQYYIDKLAAADKLPEDDHSRSGRGLKS